MSKVPSSRKKVIIATQSSGFATKFKKLIEEKEEIEVLEIAYNLEMLFQAFDLFQEEEVNIDGLIISSDLAKKQGELRLELLSDSLKKIREEHDQLNVVLLSKEPVGHPFLAEVVQLGIYSILLDSMTVEIIANCIESPMTYSQVSHLTKVDTGYQWRSELTQAQDPQYSPISPPLEKKEAEENKEVPKETIELLKLTSNLIIIGSLYPGAGSTFLTTNLAKYFSSLDLETVVIESPTIKIPYLFDLLDGQNKTTVDDYSRAHLIAENKPIPKESWKDGNITWVPLNPEKSPIQQWSYEQMLKLIFGYMKTPLILLDIGTTWLDTSVCSLMSFAEKILVVVDTDPAHVNLSYEVSGAHVHEPARIKNEILRLASENGKQVDFILNRYEKSVDTKMWIQAVGSEPLTKIPYCEYQKIIQLLYNGKLPFDNPDIAYNLGKSFFEILKAIYPEEYENFIGKQGTRFPRIFSFLNRRK